MRGAGKKTDRSRGRILDECERHPNPLSASRILHPESYDERRPGLGGLKAENPSQASGASFWLEGQPIRSREWSGAQKKCPGSGSQAEKSTRAILGIRLA